MLQRYYEIALSRKEVYVFAWEMQRLGIVGVRPNGDVLRLSRWRDFGAFIIIIRIPHIDGFVQIAGKMSLSPEYSGEIAENDICSQETSLKLVAGIQV